MTDADRKLYQAIEKLSYPNGRPAQPATQPASILSTLGANMARDHVSEDDLVFYLRSLKRGDASILGEKQTLNDLPDSEVRRILQNWVRVKSEVALMVKKMAEQDLLETPSRTDVATKRRRLTDYARWQRIIRARQPKITAAEAHAQARRAIAAAQAQQERHP